MRAPVFRGSVRDLCISYAAEAIRWPNITVEMLTESIVVRDRAPRTANMNVHHDLIFPGLGAGTLCFARSFACPYPGPRARTSSSIDRSHAKIPSYIPRLNGEATTGDDVNARQRRISRPTRLTVIFTYTHSIFCRVSAACILHVAGQCLQDQTSACLFFVRGQGNCNRNALG